MKKRRVDPWFPFWIDKWLFGSTRIELLPDERSVFVDLMSLSKKDDGYIRANEGMPYLESQLCGLLNIELELLQRTIKKCIKYHKMKRLRNGTYFMLSHEAYKLSSRQQRRVEKEMSEETDTMSENADAILNKNKINNKKLKEKSPKYKYSDAHFEIAKYLETKIKERLPRHKFTGKDYLQSWANTVRLMEEKKEATTTEIITLINWISIDSFWFKNILSMETLREKFGRLWADMEESRPKRDTIGQSKQKPTKEQEEFYQAREKKLDELNERYRPEFEQAKKNADMKAIGQIDNKIKEELAEWSREYWESK